MRSPQRRDLLGIAGNGVAAALAGCLSDATGTETEPPADGTDGTDEPTDATDAVTSPAESRTDEAGAELILAWEAPDDSVAAVVGAATLP